jgi:hypothetical protein
MNLFYINMIALCFILSGCSTEQAYRGVPEPTWKQLTPEQKQLIVDRSFQNEMQ